MRVLRTTAATVVLGIVLLTSVAGVAQERQKKESASTQGSARYYLGSLGGTTEELLMNVNVWGFVLKPGQYMVPVKTDLVSLISFAGGPLEQASLKRVQLIRGTVKDDEPTVVTVDLQKYLEQGDRSVLPTLRPGDTVVVRAGKMYGFKRALEYVWRIAVIVQAYALFSYYLRRS